MSMLVKDQSLDEVNVRQSDSTVSQGSRRQGERDTHDLSVVVIPLTGRLDYLDLCLSAITAQADERRIEIIVPFDRDRGQIASLRDRFPAVRFIDVDGKRTCAELRAIGVRNSGGRLVAITEDHCEPDSSWCEHILTEHEAPYAAVGGAVDKAGRGSVVSWAMYMCDYLRYMNPVDEGPSRNLTDCNVSYKRSSLETISEVWEFEFHEPVVHAALEAGGESLWLSSRIVVRQERNSSVSDALWDRYTYGRLFGATRVSRQPATRRLLFSMASVVLPPLLLGRIASNVLSKRRRCGVVFLRTLPLLLLLAVAWSYGEFLGYVTGEAEASLNLKQRQPRSPGRHDASPSST